MGQRHLACSTPRVLIISVCGSAPFPVLVACDECDGSVIGFMLAEGAFGYYRLLPLSPPAYVGLMVSLSYGGYLISQVFCVLSTSHRGDRMLVFSGLGYD